MSIEAPVPKALVHEAGTQFINQQGRTKAFFPAVASDTGKQSLMSKFEIMHGDLVHILQGLTENSPNVPHLFNTCIDSFTQDDEGNSNAKVYVRFQDGREEAFDLLVGADGTYSKTRRLMLGSRAPDPVYTTLEAISASSASLRSPGTQK